MPHINRIRVNNVKYNFGTQAYDDLVMKPFCGNMLYDLANGGGKSVLMLLLLQNVIPNCTLDEKQPIEKLFRGNDSSKTIHSLIEWRLDEEDIQNGFRYMTTGFCARKAADSEEESRETASIEYFNYCIFYRDYNPNDIRNLPLVKDKERITYSGLRRYLKELEHDNSLVVRIFDRKGEYQSFLTEYGIYESEWEIIRGINKTEGHVRTYFETNYKTTRKVVEDLLIEEILGTSIRRKAGRDEGEDSMSQTLLDMKDKLVDLAKQKDAVRSFDRQRQVLFEFSSRVSFLGSVYREQEEIRIRLNRIYNTVLDHTKSSEGELSLLSEQEADLEAQSKKLERELLCAGLSEDLEKLRKYRADLETLSEEGDRMKQRRVELRNLLVRKECANEYLEYLTEKKNRDEMAVTLRAMTEGSNLKKEISSLIREFEAKKEKQLQELSKSCQKAQEEENAAITGHKTAESALRDVEREQSVAKVMTEQTKKEIASLGARQKEKKDELGILLTEDAAMQLYRRNEQKKHAKERREKLRLEMQQITAQKEEALINIQRFDTEMERYREALTQKTQNRERILEMQTRADKLAEAYAQKDYRMLREAVRVRCREAYAELERVEKEEEKAKKRRQEIEAGDFFSSTEAANDVKEYIITRYKKKAVTGAEYLKSVGEEEQKRLLEGFAALPYAVVTEGFSEAAGDHLLAECVPEGVIVPVIRVESLRGGKELFHKEQMLLFSREERTLLEEKERKKEILRLEKEEEEAGYKKNRLNSLLSTYEEDEEFLTGFVKEYYTDMYSKKPDTTATDAEVDLLRERLEGEKSRFQSLSARIAEIPALEEETLAEIQRCDEDILGYKEVQEYESAISEKEKMLSELEDKLQHLKEWQADAIKLYEETKMAQEEKHAQLLSVRKQTDELLKLSESYSVYLEGEEMSDTGLSLEELMVTIDGKIAALHTQASSMEDKQRLYDSYVSAMNRLLRNIVGKGMNLADLTALYENRELFETPKEELEAMEADEKAAAGEWEALEKKQKDLREKLYRLEGKNSQAEATIREQYGEYVPVEKTGDELAAFVADRKRVAESVNDQKKSIGLKREEILAKESRFLEMKNEILRIFEGVSALSAECGMLSAGEDVEKLYEEARGKYQENGRDLQKRQEEFYRNRQTTMETLQVLGAQTLAGEISGNIQMPRNIRETEEIVRGLREVMECLELEQSRIEAGLGDMETMKQNFEEQCLQRCMNIKADLERLPKLSKIMLDGEQVPMISLQIPYVKEEFFRERMTQYIDEVVREVDKISSSLERMKYIRAALSYKKLFSVIVTDMNAIKLLLYKRERVKEQSRHLRYEEAVGSTGQSQGIYIQFLIAVINYISCIYSPRGEASGLGKVIFIDNPFGAAKDVYIWEPIFELMRANHVQLIVPARGTTPAITGRFDVNYVLGQKLIDRRQQTVIVDYCSRVETEAVEYIPLQYEQTSLDI